MDNREFLLSEMLNLVNKYSITAYEISQGTGISAVGIQKIINGESKRPLERTLQTITSYIKEKYISDTANKIDTIDSSNIKNLPHGEQMEILYDKIHSLENQLKEERKKNDENTRKIIDFIDEYLKPVFDFMQETIKQKEKDNIK